MTTVTNDDKDVGSHSLVTKELELLDILSLIKLLEAWCTNSCMGGVPRPGQ